MPSSTAAHTRSFFYIGGEYVEDGKGGHILQDQMYVEHLIPAHDISQKEPVLLMHGTCQTGTNWLDKPDGNEGWASLFLRQGYEVYIIDQVARGRSPTSPEKASDTKGTTIWSVEYCERMFTATSQHCLWPQAAKHTRWPGTGRKGDPIFDAFYSACVPSVTDNAWQQKVMQAAGAQLLDKIGKPTILIGHSQGGLYPILIADARPHLAHALVLLEPAGPPFLEPFSGKVARPYGLTDVPITYSPSVNDPAVDLVRQTLPADGRHATPYILQAETPPPRKLVNIAPLPILFMIAEASYHACYDLCTVDYLRQAGCDKLECMDLPELGIHGNGHMFILEDNSNELQGLVQTWLQNRDSAAACSSSSAST